MAIKVGMVSLGCAKNRVDAEYLLGVLQREGFELVEDASQAEAIIVNTCGFIESAKQESIDTILEMAQYKEENCKALVVTGCLSKRYGEQLAQGLPEVDAMLGIAQCEEIACVIRAALQGERTVHTQGDYRFFDVPRVLTTDKTSVYLKIADGCSNLCAYCAIPLIRGPYVSRPMEDIVKEARFLAENGAREINLIAQDTTRYGMDLYGKPQLAALLRELCKIEKLKWIRFLYGYPDLLTDEVLKVMQEEKKICRYIDIPLQHFSTPVLKRMNRRGDQVYLEKLVEKIRSLGDYSLRTTLIAGFPGETAEDHAYVLRFISEHPFDKLGVFAYSDEDGTAAQQMDGKVAKRTKTKWANEIMRLQKKISADLLKKRIGQTLEVLVEGENEGVYYGRSEYEAPESDGKVFIKLSENLTIGQFYPVKIVDALEYDLVGVVDNDAGQ